jgi:serine/threonine-protein kinase
MKKKEGDLISFENRYIYKRELGRGSCGVTVLLYDNDIDEHFVSKKYLPFSEEYRGKFFPRFLNEIKLLYRLYHRNVVRVFNYCVFRNNQTGYIFMEYIDGDSIDKYISDNLDCFTDVFKQVISGFSYLEENGVLHRDIRKSNILVSNDGLAKIIDFGFGKEAVLYPDCKNSITIENINHWCELPDEYIEGIYDFRTELYFVGMLFKEMISEYRIQDFQYCDVVEKMCKKSPSERFKSFIDVSQSIAKSKLSLLNISDEERLAYRNFSSQLRKSIHRIDRDSFEFRDDYKDMILSMKEAFKLCCLEDYIYNINEVIKCFMRGSFKYVRNKMKPDVLDEFINLLDQSTDEKQVLILENLRNSFRTIETYSQFELDEVPF